jgi:hypothetical protein
MLEELTTEQAVQKYIKPLVVKNFAQSDIADARIEELKNYKTLSGFSQADTVLSETIANKVLTKAMKGLNLNILINRPHFIDMSNNENRKTTSSEMDRMWARYDIEYLLELPEKKITKTIQPAGIFSKEKQIQIQQPQYLIEISPKAFTGKVPDFAIEATGKATQFGLKPQVWVAGTFKELTGVVREKVIDPIIIGYPYIDDGGTYRRTRGLLLAAWGKDLEAIDKAFL